MTTKVQEIVSADDKIIGFDYQHYYALLRLLRLRADESLGIEVKDDIHITDTSGKFYLLQLKHSLQRKPNGEVINLRERDYDLWHTISNWIDLIQDKNDGRGELKEQLTFVNNTIFLLVSNKSSNETNKFLINLTSFKDGELKDSEFCDYLKKLEEETTASKNGERSIKQAINKLRALSSDLLVPFLKKIDFQLDEDDLIEKIKQVLIDEHAFDEGDADDILYEIEGMFRIESYLKIKAGFKRNYTKKDFTDNILRPCFNKARYSPFAVYEMPDYVRPENLLDEVFAKQLKDIDQNEDGIYQKHYYMQLCINHLKKWSEKTGRISATERDAFIKEAVLVWNAAFNEIHINAEGLNDAQNKVNAKICYNRLMGKTLNLRNVPMDLRMCNGAFIDLSDTPDIGWLPDWKDRYKK